jgi:hypothetical protein
MLGGIPYRCCTAQKIHSNFFRGILEHGGQTPEHLLSISYPEFVKFRSKIANFFAGGLREYRDQAASVAMLLEPKAKMDCLDAPANGAKWVQVLGLQLNMRLHSTGEALHRDLGGMLGCRNTERGLSLMDSERDFFFFFLQLVSLIALS